MKTCLFNIIKNYRFVYLYLMNVLSAFLYIFSNNTNLLLIIIVSATFAFFENLIIQLIHITIIKKIIFYAFCVFLNIVIIIDGFLIYKFGRVLDVEILDTILETTTQEVKEFIQTNISVFLILFFVIVVSFINWLFFKLSVYLANIRCFRFCVVAIGFIGLIIYGYSAILLLFGKAPQLALTQQNALPRIVYTWYLTIWDEHIGGITHVCETLQAKRTTNSPDIVVVVIGESFNVTHSSLYGYSKETSPFLRERLEKGEIIVYDDVVSVADITYTAMKSIFSLDSLGVNFNSTPLFPACFKSAGFYTAMYDNEYLADDGAFQGRFILANQRLSRVMFDFRNNRTYEYDEELIKNIVVKSNTPALYIIHLWGQHTIYEKRFPKSFSKFRESNYKETGLTRKQREIIANYDNATLYNDYVLNEIIKRFEDKDCCLVYLSDHGEELYENSDYYGHGTAMNSININFQIRVPLLVWTSSKFMERNPEMIDMLLKQQHAPIITDDISHFLLKVGGVVTPWYNPQRCFIDKQYNENKPRIVLQNIDYNFYKPKNSCD